MTATKQVPVATSLPHKTRRRGRSRQRLSRGTFYLVTGMIALLFISPLVAVLFNSFKTPADAAKTPPSYLPNPWSFGNYTRLNDPAVGIGQATINSTLVAIGTVVLTVVISLLAAYGFSRFPFPGSNLLFVLMLAAIMVPFQVLVTPMYVVLKALHLTDSLIGLIVVIATFQLPFATFVLRNSFAGIPKELYEAAAIDGAGMWSTLRMLLPLLRAGLTTAALFAFFAAWNEFFAALILLSDQQKFTLPVILTTFINGARGSVDWGLLQSGVVITILPCLIIFVALQRHYVRGLVSGAVK